MGFVPPDDLDVGMVVVEIAVPTGFSPDAETLETMASDNPMIRRYDITDRHVVVYLEELVADETFALSFAAKAEHVITTQPVTSRVYSYYNPRWRAESLGPSVTVEEVPETTIACIAAVADAANADLVSDCEALLEARDLLAVNASLNWSGDTLHLRLGRSYPPGNAPACGESGPQRHGTGRISPGRVGQALDTVLPGPPK